MAVLTIAHDEAALVAAAAARLTELIRDAIDRSGSAMVSLTGGRTPRALYTSLADAKQPWRERIAWSRVHLWWGDERHVPPDDPESNYGMARDALIAHVPIPQDHVHRMRGELDARDAARLYDDELSGVFAAAGRDQVFDVMLLGLGDDAHIASIFPRSPLLGSAAGLTSPGLQDNGSGGELIDADQPRGADLVRSAPSVVAVWAPHLNAWRMTLTPATILASRAIVMFVAGPNKADAVRAALEAPVDVLRFPAQLLRHAGERVEWFMDAPAARRSHGAPPS